MKFIFFLLIVGGGLWLMYGVPDGTFTPYLTKIAETKAQFLKEWAYLMNLIGLK